MSDVRKFPPGQSRDQRIANEANDTPFGCVAHGCQAAWAIESTKLCSSHHWGRREHWPRITEAVNHRLSEIALDEDAEQHRRATAPHMTREQKTEILRNLRDLFAPGRQQADPKAWARALQAREESGERLTQAQRTMWRAALHRVLPEGAES